MASKTIFDFCKESEYKTNYYGRKYNVVVNCYSRNKEVDINFWYNRKWPQF